MQKNLGEDCYSTSARSSFQDEDVEGATDGLMNSSLFFFFGVAIVETFITHQTW